MSHVRKVSIENNKQLKPVFILTDFESRLQQALKLNFSDSIIKGCWFHFSQAILRKVTALGMKTKYLSDHSFKYWINRFIALALVPLDKIKDAFEIILNSVPELD